MTRLMLILCLLIVSAKHLRSQTIYKSKESKSGILVGTQNESSFAGISYENASDEVSFDYKWVQQKYSDFKDRSYPDFETFNIEFAIDTDKSQANLVSDNKWQGGVELSFTYAFTLDKQVHGEVVKKIEVKRYYTGLSDGIDYESESECLTKNDSCHAGREVTEYYVPRKKHTNVFFMSGGNHWERFDNAILDVINIDTTFVRLSNPGSNTTYLDFGYNWFKQLYKKGFLTLAVSFRTASVTNSTRGLKKTNIESLNGIYLNSKDTSQIISTGSEKTYFIGKTELEGVFIPRVDFFFRHDLGEKKPFLGFIAAISPLYSSSNNRWQWNMIFGPSISPATLPDQVVFAFLNQWNEDDKGKLKYSLSFRASFPISFD